MSCQIFKANPKGIEKAAHLILAGGVVAFPTETFYGLGAEALQEKALRKIFDLKGREKDKPLLLLMAERSWLRELVQEIPPLAERFMDRFWPGPLTLVLKASPHLSTLLTANTGKIGLRIPSHPVAQALVKAVDRPITGTSANLSGQPSASAAQEVLRALGAKLDGLLDGGKTAGGSGSTVLDVSESPPRVLREGVISRKELSPWIEES